MEVIKRYIFLIYAAFTFCACAGFDDSSIWNELMDHEERISELEAMCKDMNVNISSLSAILAALQQEDYVTGATTLTEGDAVVGYILHFVKSGPVTIYHGKDGGEGSSPDIGIRKAGDGRYYWTSGGEWMKDDQDRMIPATVTNPDGIYVVPQFRVADGVWYLSYDDGNTWREVGNMTAEESSGSIFKSVNISDPDCIVLTLSDGQQITIPTWTAFQELETLVVGINSSLASLHAALEALQANDHVTGIVPMTEEGKEIGYTIYFSKRDPIHIYYGQDGAAPSILAAKDQDGLYYWTLNGEWMLDGAGNRIPCTLVPRLKIEDGCWYVSYDGGTTWEPEPLGTLAGLSSKLVFAGLAYDSDYVYITMSNGEEIIIPRHERGVYDYISLDPISLEGVYNQ